MAVNIVLVRHGETAWNRNKIFRGTYDIPLNETGQAQAKLLAKVFRKRRIDAVYSSPLSRAYQTAEIALSHHQIEPVIVEEFIDINYGDWTGKEDSAVEKQWPREHAIWNNEPQKAHIPGGEALRTVFNRAFEAMECIAAKHKDQTVAIFTHRVVNKLLVLGALGLELSHFKCIMQDNCCLNEFIRTETGYLIQCINNTSHITDSSVDLLTADF